ncbi:MAG: SOS response-associated peptidase [Bacteroidetes bacterium]|nr:SOS response-associated peptidase [Bacteroidota bacterium]
MCYYNGIRVSKYQLIKLLELEKELKAMQEKEIALRSGFEYKDWPIVKPVNGGKDIEIVMAHWEFIPGWVPTMEAVKESRKKFTTLNAIGEELFDKKTYKDAAMKRRCLVLSSGFYEWRHFKPEGEKKDIAYPYYITIPGKDYFYMAGIWQPWTDRETGETIDTFAIVTTKANHLMEQVHNKKKRMPTILPDELAMEWISDGLTQQRITELATYQLPADKMAAYTIHKDFRGLEVPTEAFKYSELPELV